MSQGKLIKTRGIPIMPNLPWWLSFTQGNIWHVRPGNGSDSNYGDHPASAFATLEHAHSKATADQNDIVLLYAESNTAASTTDYQSSTLTWSKDLVHLIGVGNPSPFSNRARVAFASTYDTASNLMTISADGCTIANISLFAGVAGTNPTGCLKITGTRNNLIKMHIAGIGNDNNDIAGAYSLFLDAAQECYVDDCTIGIQTIDAGTAANSEILFDTAAKNHVFKNCRIIRRIEHATNHPLVKSADATGIDGIIFFDGCGFISVSTNDGYSNAGVFKFATAPTQGKIIISPTCYATNGTTAGKWDVGDNDYVVVTGNPTPAADTAQIGRYV